MVGAGSVTRPCRDGCPYVIPAKAGFQGAVQSGAYRLNGRFVTPIAGFAMVSSEGEYKGVLPAETVQPKHPPTNTTPTG